MLKRYEGLGEFCRVAKECQGASNSYNDGWAGNISYSEAIEKSLHGEESYVAEAEKLMDQLDAAISVPHAEWASSVYGAYPIVAEFLAGSPTPMRHRVEAESDSSPIAVYVSTTCSGGVDAETMLKRGITILALIAKMQQIRPIEVYLLAETHGQTDGEYIQVIPLDSKPIQLSSVAFAMVHVGFARHLTYTIAEVKDRFNGHWPDGFSYMSDIHTTWEPHIRQVVGMGENDLYIPPVKWSDELVREPVKWITKQIAKFTARGDEYRFHTKATS